MPTACRQCGTATCTHIAKYARQRRELVADVRFMLWTGETHIEAIARRVHATPRSLERRLQKWRPDLLRRMHGFSDDVIRKAG